MTRAATMRDVAERAGVAVSTVSRVISHPDRFSPSTRDAVLRAARELDYQAGPRGPRRRVSITSVAVLVPDITNPFNFDIIRGSQERLRASGYIQIVVDTEESAETEAHYLDLLGPTSAGIILTASRLTDQQILAAAERFRIVTVNRSVPGVPNVIVNSAAAFDQAVTHLASLGHRHICYVAGPNSSWSNRQRWEACEHAAARIGVTAVRIGPYAPKTASGAAAADAFLTTGATAGIAFNDLIAIGMLQRLAGRGFGVPEDISLIGCDDIFGADFCYPPLTTITAPTHRIGLEATTLPTESSTPSQTVTLPVHLTIRSSTGPARATR